MKRYSPSLSIGPLRVIARATMTDDTEGEYFRVAEVEEALKPCIAKLREEPRNQEPGAVADVLERLIGRGRHEE